MLVMLDAEQFAQQFKDSFRSLWLTALGVVHDSAYAEDVVQEAAVVGLGKLDQYQPDTSFRAWMGQIVRFVALNKARKLDKPDRKTLEAGALEAARPKTPPSLYDESALTGSGQLSVDQVHFDDKLKRSLEGLPRVARACLLLRTVEGLDYDEIATILDIPKGTAMSHVHRSRKQLRDVLSEKGGVR